ncbi:MAG: mechanosensitive ion channel domain-containing protein [Clostridia bacterium]
MLERFEIWFKGLFAESAISSSSVAYLLDAVYLVAIVIIALTIYFLVKKIALTIIKKIILKTRNKWDDELLESKAIHRSINIIPGIIIYSLSFLLTSLSKFAELVAVIYLSFTVVAAISAFLDALNAIYDKKYASAKQRPLKGILRVAKVFLFVIALIIVISRLMGESPVYVLSGLGALSAIILLVFKDALLGMVAGVQMASNDLVRIGDWIEMPKYGADGAVIEVALTIVKVRNFDNTITTIPSYALVSDSFKNWRGMFVSGGRRIKRAIYIDVESVEFCSDSLLESLEKIAYLKDYIAERSEEIRLYNLEKNIDTSMPVNGRRMTNIGVFRRYITEYLKNHPKIHKDMITMVRQLAPGKDGIPLEIYAFTDDTAWVNHENIMSDIFDHLFAVVPYFNLRIFQEPSGRDISGLKKLD